MPSPLGLYHPLMSFADDVQMRPAETPE
jgi:hypothetical protein